MSFLILLFLIVLLSYGQIIGMNVWQDDNGLFFKLAHINENAGYLSKGPFGSGAYKYIHTPYIPVYKLFGYNTLPYFLFTLTFYFIATIVVYFVLKKILGKTGGKIGGVLFATGYIASDGTIRLFNSVITSISIITISFLALSYFNFQKTKEKKWYFLGILFYFLSVELAVGRTHYLIAIIFLFEIIFFQRGKSILKSIFWALSRLTPFIYIFYRYYILNADQRSGNVTKFIFSIARGQHFQFFGLLSSITNVFLPDWLTSHLFGQTTFKTALIIIIIISLLIIYTILKSKKILSIFLAILLLVWAIISKNIFLVPQINSSDFQKIIAFLGGDILIILCSLLFVIDKKYKKIYLLLFLWSIINIAAYSAYNPLVIYESINRYLAHSFYAIVGLFAVLYLGLKKNKIKNFIKIFIVIWGVGNLISSIIYQRNILLKRSWPVANFYIQLKNSTPSIQNKDVFYFDIADNERQHFSDAFSVASMPETTAIAWRYGVDRYDIERATTFKELFSILNKYNIKPNQIHSFFYSNGTLTNTSGDLNKFLFENFNPFTVATSSKEGQSELVINFNTHLKPLVPIELTLDTTNSALNPKNFDFSKNKTFLLKLLAFEYKDQKENFYKNTKVTVSSTWFDNKKENLLDQDSNTLWRADRIIWGKKNPAIITIDIGHEEEINRFIWANAYGNDTPTNYAIETSRDSVNWDMAKEVSYTRRIDTKDGQVEEFKPRLARFIKFTIKKSLSGDSPGISDILVVPVKFASLNILEAEKFLNNPLDYSSDYNDYIQTLKLMNYEGSVDVSWFNNKSSIWQTSDKSRLNLNYTGVNKIYKIIIPSGGTDLSAIKLSDYKIPGTIKINKITARPLNYKEIVDYEN